MGPKRKVVPYATVDEKRDLPFTSDLELASLFILAGARRERAPLSAMALVYYPFQIRRWEGGALLIDKLGLNHASIKYRIIPDVDDFKRALNAASDDPGALREVLKEKVDFFKDFTGQKTVRIDGLIVRPGMSAELSELLAETSDLEPIEEPVVFKTTLKGDDIESILGSIPSLRGDIEGDMNSLERSKRSLANALDKCRRVLREEIRDTCDVSERVKARIREEFEEVKARRRETLELELERIRKEYGGKVNPLRGERNNLKRRLARRRRKLDLLKAGEEELAADEGLLREVEELEAKLEEADSAISSLKDWRDAKVEEARARYNADIKPMADMIKEETARNRGEVQRIKAEISELEGAARIVAAQIDRLIRSKKNKLLSLSRLCFDVEAETADLYVPFYVFNYGGKEFDFYPPVVASSARGFLSRFKRMLADNLQSKITQLIKPRTPHMDRYLAKAVKALGRSKGLAAAYQREGERLNLLRSREAVDRIMAGLVKIRREGWISDGEYIRLQEALIENLSMISRP